MADRSERLKHLFPGNITIRRRYTAPGQPRDSSRPPAFPRRPKPAEHARSLLQQLESVTQGGWSDCCRELLPQRLTAVMRKLSCPVCSGTSSRSTLSSTAMRLRQGNCASTPCTKSAPTARTSPKPRLTDPSLMNASEGARAAHALLRQPVLLQSTVGLVS